MAKLEKYELQDQKAEILFDSSSRFSGVVVEVVIDVSLNTLFDFEDGYVAGKHRELFQRFGDEILVSWNVHKDGNALPASGEGMGKAPLSLASEIMIQWLKAAAKPPDPLAMPSENGSSSEAESTAQGSG